MAQLVFLCLRWHHVARQSVVFPACVCKCIPPHFYLLPNIRFRQNRWKWHTSAADDSLAAWSMLSLECHLSPSPLWDPSSCPETDVWTALTLCFWDQFGLLSSINICLHRCKNIPDYLRARRSLFLFFLSFLQSVSFHILIQVCKVNKQALRCWAPPCCS